MKLDIPDEFTRKADSVRISYLARSNDDFGMKIQIPFEKLQFPFKKIYITLFIFFSKTKQSWNNPLPYEPVASKCCTIIVYKLYHLKNNTNPSFI